MQHEPYLERGWIGEPAAQYLRMSTDEQDYSTSNQAEAIEAYAIAHNFSIIRTYRDEGRSGLLFESRPGLRQLISDVQGGQTDFTTILVYDVSRWGRFQDVDEGAYYEQICKKAGVRVVFCAGEFENDGSVTSILLKALDRLEAAKFSRGLSIKVFAGQCNLVRRGFWQGGAPGYGLRRALIDASGSPRTILAHGERKYIQSDRVILVPGPANEVEIVKRVFDSFVTERKTSFEIAAELNGDGIANALGRPWSRANVRNILTGEKYIGTNLFNRCSVKLKGKRVHNAPDKWIRVENAFEGIVDRPTFEAARQLEDQSRTGITNEVMLRGLAALLKEKGRLTCQMINEAEKLPHSALFRLRFGSLPRLFESVGYRNGKTIKQCSEESRQAARRVAVAAGVTAELERVGLPFVLNRSRRTLEINQSVFSFFTVKFSQWASRSQSRRIQSGEGFRPAGIIAVRMNQANLDPLDYLLLPTDRVPRYRINFNETSMARFDQYRFRSIDGLIEAIMKRVGSTSLQADQPNL